MEELMKKLRSPSQRLIKIIIGHKPEQPLQVQQQVLESLSPYFVAALKEDAFEEGKSGILAFPEDELDVWEILLYWTLCRKFPHDFIQNGLDIAVRCWTTSDKYGIEAFQDAVMLQILRDLTERQIGGEPFGVGDILTVFERTAPKALLRELVLEYVTVATRHAVTMEDALNASFADMHSLDGSGFFPEVMAKKAIYDTIGDIGLNWKYNCDHRDQPEWEEFFFLPFEGYAPDASR